MILNGEARRGVAPCENRNSKHETLNKYKALMTKTFRILDLEFRYCLVFGASDLEFGAKRL